MTSAQDPFYIVKEEIQESIDKLHDTFCQRKQTPSNTGEHVHLTKELLASCENLEWQVDELNKTIAVASRDPAFYGLDELELEKRRRWTTIAQNQVGIVRKAIEAGRDSTISSGLKGTRQELMRNTNGRSNQYIANDNDDFISSESDKQMLLIKRQDEELDEVIASVQRIGGVGLTIHEELTGQERILDQLTMDTETTSNRLDFVQKKVTMVMKKVGVKGQLMMMAFLVLFLIILFILVFLT